jgi:hypothetical protein
MTDQTTAFASVPEVEPTTTRFTCTRCGNDDPRRVWADPSRPSLDARYALGWCDNCAPARKGVKGVTRDTVALIQSELFDRDAFLAREAAKAEQKLLSRFRLGHQLTEDEIAQVKAIIARQLDK